MTAVAPVGSNPTRLWGLSAQERLGRIAAAQKMEVRADGGLLVNLGFAFDPSWLKLAAARPGLVVTRGGVPVLAHVGADEDMRRAMEGNAPLPAPRDWEVIAWETAEGVGNDELRKKERPFLDRLGPETVRGLERASYFGAYKGVTDLLTKYLWPEWALVLTRWAARIGMSPNQVTFVGAVLCLLATWLFHEGWYWTGLASGLVFMVLDTVDGKLARCTITSSKIGEAFDHGIDLVHPPFWWWAWAVGLGRVGLGYSDRTFAWVLGAILGGYVVQRLIEGAFMRRWDMHIHVWRKVDSDFRLVTARRNPNMVILFAATLVGRPDLGLIAVAVWTVLSCLFHLVRLIQAFGQERRGEPILSWLA